MGSSLDQEFQQIASREGDVRVDISYDIIRQFSSQLYTNPRKAIEELACNSYDAGATECHIRIPQQENEPLVVLDNGKSMDLNGLKELWAVARSPKVRSDGPRIDNNRLQIGKFGVGKLAAYALGRKLTHVATINGTTRVVSVDEERLKNRTNAPRFNVYRTTQTHARKLLEPLLASLPRPWDEGWDTWTLAMVDDVPPANLQKALKIGVLLTFPRFMYQGE